MANEQEIIDSEQDVTIPEQDKFLDLRSALTNELARREEKKEGFLDRAAKGQDRFLRNINTGISRTLGLPHMLADFKIGIENKILNSLGIKTEDTDKVNFIPSGQEIQDFFAENGMAFKTGQEPDDTLDRTVQNIGSSAPFFPITMGMGLAKGTVMETVSSFMAAAGGKFAEGTPFAKKHPVLARALGELVGGLSGAVGANIASKGGLAVPAIKKGSEKVSAIRKAFPKPQQRAARRLERAGLSPSKAEEALENIRVSELTDEGKFLFPSQSAESTPLARVSSTIRKEVPEVEEAFTLQRGVATKELQSKFVKSGDISDARALIERRLQDSLDEASVLASKVDDVADPAVISTRIHEIIRKAERSSRQIERSLWNNLPSEIKVNGSNTMAVYKRNLSDLTEGASKERIVSFIESKLGNINKEGKLVGGSLFSEAKKKSQQTGRFELATGKPIFQDVTGKTNASAKAIHQFYSDLGQEIASLSTQKGQTNKIRILGELREAVFKDMNTTSAGKAYQDAIDFSSDLNTKFTRGAIGKILGFERGDTPDVTRAIEQILTTGGQSDRNAIAQALTAAPEVSDDLERLMRNRFVDLAIDRNTRKINVKNANTFIDNKKGFGRILDDFFPDLKEDIIDATKSQGKVDDILGVSQVHKNSPLLSERSAAAFFLKQDPGQEIAKLLNDNTIKRTEFLTDLVKEVKGDDTGKALRGLQNAFSQEIIKFGRGGTIDNPIISGNQMLNQLNKFEKSIISSKLYNKTEYSNLKKIAKAFEAIEIESKAKALAGEGVIDDLPAKILSIPIRVLAARAGGKVSERSMGGSIQTANIFVKEANAIAKAFTNDEARNILIKAVTDPQTMKDLLTDVTKLKPQEQIALFARIMKFSKNLIQHPFATTIDTGEKIAGAAIKTGVNIVKDEIISGVPAGAVAPALGSASEESERRENINKIKQLLSNR